MSADGALPHFEEGEPLSAEDWAALEMEHANSLDLKPHERKKFEERLRKVGAKEAISGELRVVAKLRPEDRKLMQEAVTYWSRALREIEKPPIDPLVEKVWRGGQGKDRKAASKSGRARFASQAVETERTVALRADHPAIEETRTIFPTTVESAWLSPRLLVSGHNNAKLGAKVEKGPWAGAPIYQLTLEERATCPRSCAQFESCYGNALHLARRHDARSENFLEFLASELWLLSRANRQHGIVVRLHTLGDFYSVEYVDFWRDMLRRIQSLKVWGYTAYHADASDPKERAIGEALAKLASDKWDQFALRFSNKRESQSTIVIDTPEEAEGALLCPAQHGVDSEAATASCATCGLCWAPAMRERTIAFLRHGMKTRASATE